MPTAISWKAVEPVDQFSCVRARWLVSDTLSCRSAGGVSKGSFGKRICSLEFHQNYLIWWKNPLIVREVKKRRNRQEISKGTFYNGGFPILKTLMANCPWLHPVVKISYALNFRRPDSTSTLNHENKMCNFITLSALCFSLLNCASTLTADEWAQSSPLPHICSI